MGDDVTTWMRGTRKKSAILIIAPTSLSIDTLTTRDKRPRRIRYQISETQLTI